MTAAAFKSSAEAAPQSGARLLVSTLERLGVEVVFGYPGGARMPVYELLDGSKLKHILVRHHPGPAIAPAPQARTQGPAWGGGCRWSGGGQPLPPPALQSGPIPDVAR